MSIVLWILQVGISVKLIFTAFSHTFKYSQTNNRPLLLIASIGLLLCAGGLIVPGTFRVVTWITPLASVVLAALMVFALIYHQKCSDHTALYSDIVLITLTVFIALGRKFIVPL